MRVWLRPDKLAILGITPSDIQNAIKEQNAQSPAGRIGAEPAPPGQEMQFNVRALGLLKDPKEFEEIIIRSNPDGSQVKIKDVGRVELGAQTYDLRGRFDQSGRQSAAGALGILPRAGRERHRDGGQREEDSRGRQDAVPAGHGLRRGDGFHPADQSLDGGDRAYAVRGRRAGADRGLSLPAKLPRDDHSDVHGARLAAGRVHHVPGAGLQRERADDVRPGAGHRHRGGRRHRRGRGRATSPRARQGTRGGDPAGDEGSVRAGGGHRSGALRRVRAGGVHGRCDRPALQPVRPHHRRGGGLLGDQRADAQPRVVRLDAQEADAGTRARSRRSSSCSTGSSTG